MYKRSYFIYLFWISCVLLSGLLVSPATVAEAEGESLEIIFIQFGLEDGISWFRLEGIADGYQEPPELTVYINEEWREVSIFYVDCPEGGDNTIQLCWETAVFFETEFPGPLFEFTVVDEANGVSGFAWIQFMPNGVPNQCSGVCGV